jgi:hypothetical protein
MKRKYQSYLIPKLIGKKHFNNIINYDKKFYDNRRRQLDYFIKYLSTHHKLQQTEEFKKFMNDPEFDDYFFKNDENNLNEYFLYYYKESAVYKDGLTNKIYGAFSGFFKKEEEYTEKNSEEQETIMIMERYYKRLLENLKQIKAQYVRYYIFIFI